MASKNKKDHRYTEEQKNFLKENISNFTYKELASAFNDRFGANVNHQSISDICLKRLKIKRDKPYVFFKGRKDFTSHPIGTEVFDGHYVWVKVNDEYIPDGTVKGSKQLNPNWVKKHILVYENRYGPIQDGGMVVFLDQNKKNCSIENLYLTTRKINFFMNKNGWYGKSRDLTLTAIKWCELFYAIKKGLIPCTTGKPGEGP